MVALVIFYNASHLILLRLQVKKTYKINKKLKNKLLCLSVVLLLLWSGIVSYMLYYAYYFMAQPAGDMPDILIAGAMIICWSIPVCYRLVKIFFLFYKMSSSHHGGQ